jgi:hypothetical protein
MLSLRSCLIASALLLTGLATGCKREPVRMRNMTMETGRSGDTTPITIRPGKVLQPAPVGPAPPPRQKP